MSAPVKIASIYGRKAAQGHGFNWITVIAMTVFHIGAVAAFFYIDLGAMLAAAAMWFVAGSLGIGMAYHRLLTHRGYKTYKWVEYFLTVCGTLALEGGPIFWVATHRIHHQHSDHEGDPHTPREGTFWAHMGWIFMGKAMHHNTEVLRRYVPDLSKDPVHVWLTTWHWVPQVVVGLAFAVFGGLPYVLWAVFFRTTYGLHATWLVNSATHLWGSRRFKTKDDSTNNWWVALLTFGEGWHNNHHAHPVSARHGLAWYELDINYINISILRMLGLAWDIKVARIENLHRMPQQTADAIDISSAEPLVLEKS
ncbi:acyl-CoA desaturase [Luteitalea sp.]|jgi:stearoyl-CoA desaturase (delta-9 desaturase)|uniref:acyl-CoA desaturase n=1 Tax=Luteitalea sp. TaxID=2004800 RepID=UPI0037C8F0FB